MLTAPLLLVPVFMIGAVIGSFLNVVIYRLPRGESVVTPPSHCPHCGTHIAPWHNIPIFSYLLLGARCRHCRNPISLRYPLVEAANALLYLCLALRFGVGIETFVWAAYGSALIAITGIDIDHKLIPDIITLPGIILGLAASLFTPLSFWDATTAFLVGGSFFYAVAFVSDHLLGKPGMGGGDIKMTAMMGAFLGLEKLVVAVFLALLSGSVVSLVLIGLGRKSRKDIIPFGPFLALGGITVVFWGRDIVDWYFRISGF